MRRATARVATLFACVCGFAGASGCGNGDASGMQTLADSVAAATGASGIIAPDTAGRTLEFAAGSASYAVDATGKKGNSSELPEAGTLSGEVHFAGPLPVDTTVTPDRDSTGCAPFTAATFPEVRRARTAVRDTVSPTVGNALVWLVGVTHGARDDGPRRITMELDDCHVEPRVIVVPVGATLIMHNRDDLISKLQFMDYDRAGAAPRVNIGFTDAGAVVPTSLPFARPGLVEVRDTRHAWVRAFVAVAPHPFVAITEADGAFSFEGVPPGSYQLVVWHERLGSRVMPVTISATAKTTVTIEYDRASKH